jgi:cytochrome d ubiquinol oxidase subunit II
MLAATATAVYPVMLRSTLDPANNLTAANSSAGELSLHVGLIWWIIAIILTIGYFIHLFRVFGGKVQPGDEH